MQRINIFQFYRFGQKMEQLSLVDREKTILDQLSQLWDADKALDDILAQEQIPLKGIAPAGQELKSRIAAITDRVNNDKFVTDEKIKPTPFRLLEDSLRKFETVFEAEVADRVAVYSVLTKGIYNTSLLVENADLVIAEELRGLLPESALYDLKQSGKCLAFEVSTAAGFHVLRATEAVIKEYYKSLTGNAWDDVFPQSQRNWGKYISALNDEKAEATITASLEQIRTLYRNPIAHPEAKLDNRQATSLFSMATSVMSLMLAEINPRSD